MADPEVSETVPLVKKEVQTATADHLLDLAAKVAADRKKLDEDRAAFEELQREAEIKTDLPE